MKWTDLFKKTRVFEKLSLEEINLVEKLASERNYKAGTKIVEEGSPCDEFFICVEGELAVQIDVPGRGVITTSTISRSNVFGWSALTDIPDYTASVVVNKDSKMLVFSGAKLKELFDRDCCVGYKVMRGLIKEVNARFQDARFGLASCILESYKK